MRRRESTMMVVATQGQQVLSCSEVAALIPIKVMDLCVVHTC